MTKKELDSFKKRLLEDRQLLLDNIARENQELESSDVEEGDIVDIASASYDKNLLIGIMDRVEREQLEKIDSALLRIEEGTFGKCISCGCAVDDARLKVMPVSLKCISCKQTEDNASGYAFSMEAAPPFSSAPAPTAKSAKKTAPKKSAAAKKSPAQKTSTKKTSPKKATPKKSAVKKAAPKKATPKTAVKKAAPKKAAPKKAAAVKKKGTKK